MYNLVGNAVKFTEAGSVVVALAIRPEGARTVRLDVAVIDAGIGIALADQKRIFEEFEILDTDHRHLRESTGLGLTIASLAVRQMNGTLDLTSEPGEGSTFSFSILLSTDASTIPATSSGKNPHHTEFPGSLDVLVVDDNPINLQLLATMVRRIGHVADVAADGGIAVGLAAMRAYDIILMDVSMPVMDGYAATRTIRAGGSSQDAIIIAVTAYADGDCAEGLHNAGVDAVLMKPATQAEIAEAMHGSWQARAERASDETPVPDDQEQIELQHAITSLSDMVGADNALRLLRAGVAQVVELLDDVGAQPELDDTRAEDIHRVVGSTAVLGLTGLSQALQQAEQAARAKDWPTLREVLEKIKSKSRLISAGLDACI